LRLRELLLTQPHAHVRNARTSYTRAERTPEASNTTHTNILNAGLKQRKHLVMSSFTWGSRP
jgi:hypothetical protein